MILFLELSSINIIIEYEYVYDGYNEVCLFKWELYLF